MAYLPNSHVRLQGTSSKLTHCKMVLINKINTFNIKWVMNVFFKLNGTSVC